MPERVNLWGYAPANYFAVKASYAKGQDAAVEWKKLIRALHENHMECVMEMYFPENVNQNLILDALRYWVRELSLIHIYMRMSRSSSQRFWGRSV